MMGEEMLGVAAKALGLTEGETLRHCKPVPEIGGWYAWSPIRGGKAVLVNEAGERLVAPSSVNFKAHVEEFLKGRRN